MVPPATVLTNKNSGTAPRALALALALCVCWSGCTPPGQRALLQGKKLVDEGRFAEGVSKLEKATRLLPKFAPGWNYLGLAYQGNRQADQALRAYRTALELDHKLAAARYNMACLFLEEGNLTGAMDELRSYTLLQPSALHGWLKLGTAQLRARRLDEAEKTLRIALELQPHHPEALNSLGLVQYQRRRWQDALNYFNVALAQETIYPPALLNSAVVHQQLGARAQALGRYRQYLALQPRPRGADAVEALARRLEAEIPIPFTTPRSGPTNLAAQLIPKTNPPPGLTPMVRTTALANASLRTNVLSGIAPVVKRPPTVSMAASNDNAAKKALTQDLASVPGAGSKPNDVEVTRVQEELVIQPAQDLGVTPVTASNRLGSAAREATPLPSGSPGGTNAPRRSLLARLNPFSGKTSDANKPGASVNSQDSAPKPIAERVPISTPDATAPARPVLRYARLSPAKPSPGNRTEADKAFRRGAKAQQGGDRVQAIAEYQAALQADPAFFNAYYNLGLAALDVGDVRLSLAAYETALALNPDSTDARYNFALGLKNAGYYQDASEELSRILAGSPDDARAHLALANICAQYQNQPRPAREHYLRVLEINPRHPEAGKIRFWLAANP
jgi:tetratricopeptide (TPR) repeat protein